MKCQICKKAKVQKDVRWKHVISPGKPQPYTRLMVCTECYEKTVKPNTPRMAVEVCLDVSE